MPFRTSPATRALAASLAVLLAALPTSAATVTIPSGTTIYGVTDEKVTSKTKKEGTSAGDIVRAHAWRDVVVDGRVFVEAGAPMLVRVSEVRNAKLAGIKGKLELEAMTVVAVDGSEVELFGGYDKSGHGRKALSITLAAVVAWPLIFIRGKNAVLDAGTVFDANVERAVEVRASEVPARTIRLSGSSQSLDVEVLYDEMDPDGKSKLLPIRLTACGAGLQDASVVSVNGGTIAALPVTLTPAGEVGGCPTARGALNLKVLGKHFTRGINRFEVEAGGLRDEVVLDIEL